MATTITTQPTAINTATTTNKSNFKAKDLLAVDDFFVPRLKSAIGAGMTYLISECAFIKSDKDGDKVLNESEYNALTTEFNFDLSGKKADKTKDKNDDKNSFLVKMLELISNTVGCTMMGIPGMEECTQAFKNTLNMMIEVDENNNGKIEENEFDNFLDKHTTEPLPSELKQKAFLKLTTGQKGGDAAVDLGAFTKFALESKLAWYPTKKINTARVLDDVNAEKTGKVQDEKNQKPWLV